MPYIKKEDRSRARFDPITVGELNFAITRLILHYVNLKGLSYQTINDIKGALGCAWDEFYRRKVVSYEDKKIKENGDVY